LFLLDAIIATITFDDDETLDVSRFRGDTRKEDEGGGSVMVMRSGEDLDGDEKGGKGCSLLIEEG